MLALRRIARPLGVTREWRNWQTRTVQVRVPVRVWGFKSPLAHTSPLPPSRDLWPYFGSIEGFFPRLGGVGYMDSSTTLPARCRRSGSMRTIPGGPANSGGISSIIR